MPGTRKLSSTDFSSLKGVNLADGTSAADAVNKGQLDTAETNAKSRANHVGLQLASTVSDFDTQVRISRLDQFSAPTGPVSLNAQRLTGVGAATADTDASQWGQIKDLLSGRRKADVRLATISSHGLTGLAAIDGITPVAADRILVTGQTTSSANGIYAAASGAWARDTDADNASEFSTAWLVSVREGTVNGDTVWQHTTDGVVTLGTTSLTFGKMGPISAVATDGYTTTCPSTAAGSAWVVTHNLNTKYLLEPAIARVASPYDFVDARVERTGLNSVTVLPDIALAAGEYEIMIRKAV